MSMPRKGKVRLGLGLITLAFSIVLLVWGYWPAHRELRARPVFVASGSASESQRAITLLFPPKIRVGEKGVVRLTLDVEALKGIPAVPSTSSSNVIAEARFDLPGIFVQPSELISAPVSPGQTAVFYWTLRPDQAGKFPGTIWLYLRTVDRLTGKESRETVSAQIVEIEAVKFLGWTMNRVRISGMIGFAIGFFLSLPFLEAQIGGFIQKRRLISK